MRSPSIKRLTTEFDITVEEAKLVKALCAARDNEDALRTLISEKCPATHVYERSLHSSGYSSRMWRTTLVLHALDKILNTCGVEALRKDGDFGESRHGYAPKYEYLNTGDPYSTTLMYKRDTDNLYIGCWGSVVEGRHL